MNSRNLSWIPNSLTVMRLLLGIALPWVPSEWQFTVLIVAGFSDLIDGWISRLLEVTSHFGQILDPIADKMLVLCALLTALYSGWVTWPALIALASRDIMVTILTMRAVALDRNNWKKLTPRLSGKFATAAQLIALLSLFWYRHSWPEMVWIATAFSMASAIDYLHRAWRA